MQTIQIEIYAFNELSNEAKENAIEQIRQKRYNCNDYINWIIDDCYLFEPKNDELFKLFGVEYSKFNNPIIGNSRKNIYFDLDRNRHIDASEAMIINNEKMFLSWLEIPENMHDKFYFLIKSTNSRYPDTYISFEENECDYQFSDIELNILENANDKFSNHMENVLNNLENSFDYCFSDESLINEIEANDYQFTENGEIY